MIKDINKGCLKNKNYILTTCALRKLYNDKTGIHAVNLNLKENEIVAIVGKSGSGKSTLLRLLSGLIKPDSGIVKFKNQDVIGPVNGINMVFQHYALLPWENVFNNVAFGLQAKGVDKNIIKQKVEHVLDLIGLSDFASYYPSELSGGMSQRVGFARAIVMNPDVLMLDEAFSALDAVTAMQLRSDFMKLWVNKSLNIKSVVMVTHNIKEALEIADRILVIGGNPGRVIKDINLSNNSDRNDFSLISSYEKEIYSLLLAT